MIQLKYSVNKYMLFIGRKNVSELITYLVLGKILRGQSLSFPGIILNRQTLDFA